MEKHHRSLTEVEKLCRRRTLTRLTELRAKVVAFLMGHNAQLMIV